MSEIKFNISPEEALRQAGIKKYKVKTKWISVKYCPFCNGGIHSDIMTFAVHKEHGHYVCKRSKCGATGNFWKLLLQLGLNPKDYVEKRKTTRRYKYRRVHQ